MKGDFLKCGICGRVVRIIKEGRGELICCGKPMQKTDEAIVESEVKFGSAKEIIEFAVKREEEAKAFYLEWKDKVSDPSVKKMFGELADEEERHREFLSSVKSEPEKIKALIKEEKVPDMKVSDFTIPVPPSGEMTIQEALILAMHKEKASFLLYTKLAEETVSEELRKVLKALAQEEAKHKLRIEKEYEELIFTEN